MVAPTVGFTLALADTDNLPFIGSSNHWGMLAQFWRRHRNGVVLDQTEW